MRIGINIPNDMVKRLGPYKPFVNISQVCRDAISKYVVVQERAQEQAEGDDVDRIASRLFEQKKTISVDWELYGLEDAKDWTSLASKDDWDALLYRLDLFEEKGISPFDQSVHFIPRVKGVRKFYDHQYEVDSENGWFAQRIHEEDNPYLVAQSEYLRGFLTYIMIVRQKVREKLTADLKAQEEKIKQMKAELKSNIEVPDGLRSTDEVEVVGKGGGKGSAGGPSKTGNTSDRGRANNTSKK